jgi:hypothetical protein
MYDVDQLIDVSYLMLQEADIVKAALKNPKTQAYIFNPFTASCENAMTLSVPDVPASCEKFPHSSQLNF